MDFDGESRLIVVVPSWPLVSYGALTGVDRPVKAPALCWPLDDRYVNGARVHMTPNLKSFQTGFWTLFLKLYTAKLFSTTIIIKLSWNILHYDYDYLYYWYHNNEMCITPLIIKRGKHNQQHEQIMISVYNNNQLSILTQSIMNTLCGRNTKWIPLPVSKASKATIFGHLHPTSSAYLVKIKSYTISI